MKIPYFQEDSFFCDAAIPTDDSEAHIIRVPPMLRVAVFYIVCCSMLRCVLQCVAVRCGVLQCFAMCCSVLQWRIVHVNT